MAYNDWNQNGRHDSFDRYMDYNCAHSNQKTDSSRGMEPIGENGGTTSRPGTKNDEKHSLAFIVVVSVILGIISGLVAGLTK